MFTSFAAIVVKKSFLFLGLINALMVLSWGCSHSAIAQNLPYEIKSNDVVSTVVQEDLGVMKPEEIRSIIQQAAKAWMTGDADAFANLFASDGVFIIPGKRWVGATAIKQTAAEFAATHSDVKIEIQQILIEGNHTVVEWSWQDTEKLTGKRQTAEDAIVVDFKNGRISRWREYIDTETTKNKEEEFRSQNQ